MGTSEDLFRIGKAAQSVGLSLRTVRYWEEIGLVQPATRSKGGYRLYSGADLHRLRVIKAMKPLGLTLEEMRELLDLVDEASAPSTPQVDLVFDRLEVLALRVRNQVERMERDVSDAHVLLAELEESLNRRPSQASAVAR
jgi:DNA-binding transcriptional MerR regulator